MLKCAALQFIDVIPCCSGEAHMVEAAAAFVERYTWVAGMLNQSHAQSARVHEVDPRKARGLVEPVTPDLEAEYPGVPPRACMAVGDRQVEMRESGQRSGGCHRPILPQPAPHETRKRRPYVT